MALNFPDPNLVPEYEYTTSSGQVVKYEWNGFAWVIVSGSSGGGTGGGEFAPMVPFSSVSTLDTIITSLDGRLEFSLDYINWETTIFIPINTAYHVRWHEDINDSPDGAFYATEVNIDFPNIQFEETVEYTVKSIDRVPDQFAYQPQFDVGAHVYVESNFISPLGSINAPAQIWCTTDADDVQVNINGTGWVTPPVAPGDLRVGSYDQVRLKHETGFNSDTLYTTTVNIGYGTGNGEFTTADFETTTEARVISKPVITKPIVGDTIDTYTFEVESTDYDHVGAGTHESTTWQLSRTDTYSDLVLDITSTTDLTDWLAEPPAMNDEKGYLRCRYNGSTGISSEWSDTIELDFLLLYIYKLEVEMHAGDGSLGKNVVGYNPPYSSGGTRGMARWEMNLGPLLNPTGSISVNIGTKGDGATVGVGHGNGGTASNCAGQAGAGGGASMMSIDGTVVAVCGGGGGGGNTEGRSATSAAGGYGGMPGEDGKNGNDDRNPGGVGGLAGNPNPGTGGNGGACGGHGRGGGAGGGGGNPGSGGSGGTGTHPSNAAGGGGGGGYWIDTALAGGWESINLQNLRTADNTQTTVDGKFVVTLKRAAYTTPTNFVNQQTWDPGTGQATKTIQDLVS